MHVTGIDEWKHGICNRHFTRHQWIKRGAAGTGAYKPNLYRTAESSMDRDNGTSRVRSSRVSRDVDQHRNIARDSAEGRDGV